MVWPPPPPSRQQQQPTNKKYGTIDSLFSASSSKTKTSDAMANSSLNDIDGDDDDESTEVSDNDSVLAMAKRLDAASVISDPSFIEGAHPHLKGVDPGGGLGGGRGPPPQHSGYGRPGGLYNRMDSIASESSSSESSSSSGSSSSGSSSDGSFERNPHRGKQQQKRPMGQPRVGFHDSNTNRRGGYDSSAAGPPELNPNRGGVDGGNNNGYHHRDMGPPELNPNRGRNNTNGGGYFSSEPPELNPNRGRDNNNGNKGVRFAERGQRRTYNNNPNKQQYERRGSGGADSRGGDSRNSNGNRSNKVGGGSSSKSRDGDSTTRDGEKENAEHKRRMKMIAIPVVICLIVVGAATGIALAVGNNKEDDANKKDANTNIDESIYDIKPPTASPTLAGLYNCIPGKAGPAPIRGCLGFVQCDSLGNIIKNPIWCPSGTSYDVTTDNCNFADQVDCDTKLPPTSMVMEAKNPPKPSMPPATTPPVATTPAPRPNYNYCGVNFANANSQCGASCYNGRDSECDDGTRCFASATNCPMVMAPDPTPLPTTTPKPTVATFEITPSFEEVIIGPETTYDHKLEFMGVDDPGDITTFETYLETYVRMFYSPSNLAKLDVNDPFRGLTEIGVDITLVGYRAGTDDRRKRRRRQLVVEGENNVSGVYIGAQDVHNMATQQQTGNIRGAQQNNQHKSNGRRQQVGAQFVAIYDQTTTYKTSDPSVTLDMVIKRPFDDENSDTFVSYLKKRDMDTFATLTSVEFLEEEQQPPQPEPLPLPLATPEPTRKPTNEPIAEEDNMFDTNKPTPFEAETDEPTPKPTPKPTQRPTPSPTTPARPAFKDPITIQGLLWLDTNENGIFETTEPPMEGLFVNLRECAGDRWKATTTTNAIGQYQFPGVEEGSYYVDFFKPNPVSQYSFTIPKVGGNDNLVLDSDVVRLENNRGKSDCMKVTQGFSFLTNAGYKKIEEEEEDDATPSPTPKPTTPRPTPNPTRRPILAAPRFCAFVSGQFNENFDFEGCSLPCDGECPDGMLCAFTNDC